MRSAGVAVSDHRSLEALLRPRAIALWGHPTPPRRLVESDLRERARAKPAAKLYPINPRRETCGASAVTPRSAICRSRSIWRWSSRRPERFRRCCATGVAHGLQAATIYAAGFGEGGDPEGVALGAELAELSAAGLRICGPNCMGTLSVAERLYLYPAARVRDVQPGDVALVMQSGGLFQYWTQYAAARGLGLSYAISSGTNWISISPIT